MGSFKICGISFWLALSYLELPQGPEGQQTDDCYESIAKFHVDSPSSENHGPSDLQQMVKIGSASFLNYSKIVQNFIRSNSSI